MSEGNPFAGEIVDGVRFHMNRDHRADSLLIVRALGGQPTATAAEVTDLDGTTIEFRAQVAGSDVSVRVPWSQPLTERAQIRAEVTRMYDEACGVLGIEPRAAQQH
jgi:putative heme iron utilization protein